MNTTTGNREVSVTISKGIAFTVLLILVYMAVCFVPGPGGLLSLVEPSKVDMDHDKHDEDMMVQLLFSQLTAWLVKKKKQIFIGTADIHYLEFEVQGVKVLENNLLCRDSRNRDVIERYLIVWSSKLPFVTSFLLQWHVYCKYMYCT